MIRPLGGDTAHPKILAMLDACDDWQLVRAGTIQVAAAETMNDAGGDYQRVVIVEMPVRRNHHNDPLALRFMISPEDAIQLADMIRHPAAWLLAPPADTGQS